MADEIDGVIAEDTPLGTSGPLGEGEQIVAGTDEAKPDLDIPGKPEDEAKAEKPEPKEVKLPWDKARQKSDQEAANMRKRLDQAEHVIEELRAAQAPPSDDEKALDDAINALESLEVPVHAGEYATDEQNEEYAKAIKQYPGEKKKLAAAVKALTVKVKNAKPATPAKPKEDPEPDEGPTQADFDQMCREAEIEFGSEHGDTARPECIREMKKLGFTADNRPTKEQLGKIVSRVYRTTAAKADSGKSEEVDSQPQPRAPRQTPQQRHGLPPGRVYLPSIDELAADMSAGRPLRRISKPT